jgi:hypothetical protein
MKVYILEYCEPCEGCTIHGVFSTKEKAEQYRVEVAKEYGDHFAKNLDLDEYEVDKGV